ADGSYEGNRAAYERSACRAAAPLTVPAVPKSWMPRSGRPHVWWESKIVTAAEAFVSRLREWRESGSEIQTTSNNPLRAKYMWLMCARPAGHTVARAHRGDAFIKRRARRSSRSEEKRRDRRSIVTAL